MQVILVLRKDCMIYMYECRTLDITILNNFIDECKLYIRCKWCQTVLCWPDIDINNQLLTCLHYNVILLITDIYTLVSGVNAKTAQGLVIFDYYNI